MLTCDPRNLVGHDGARRGRNSRGSLLQVLLYLRRRTDQSVQRDSRDKRRRDRQEGEEGDACRQQADVVVLAFFPGPIQHLGPALRRDLGRSLSPAAGRQPVQL
jgi:hypothetical protein